MDTLLRLPPDPWVVGLVVVVRSSHTGGERRAIACDVEAGVMTRIGPGAYARTAEWAPLPVEDQHVLRMRAIAAASPGPVVLSHWSAAVLHGLPVPRSRLDRSHVTVEDEDERHRTGVTHHHFLLTGRPARFHGLLATDVGRTVVDIAGAVPLDESVTTADAALRQGVPRAVLEAAIELAGPRRASRRIRDAVAFAHPGAESAGESRMRVTMLRIGVEPPVLQRRLILPSGRSAYLDAWFPREDAALEADGEAKLRDPAMTQGDVAAAYIAEKRREDQVRPLVRALGRVGYRQTGDASLLRPALASIGVRPPRRPVRFEEYAEAARHAVPRFGGPTPRWQIGTASSTGR